MDPLPAYAERDWMPSAGDFPLYLINWSRRKTIHRKVMRYRLSQISPEGNGA